MMPMPFKPGHKHNENWYRAVSKPRPESVRKAISRAQIGRAHQPHEGFQPGHAPHAGTEATRFRKGLIPWNKGKGTGRDPIAARYQTYKFNAKKRRLGWEVTKAEFRVYATGKCAYCGEPACGIDRVNNALGYVVGNMVACCQICNHMKHTLTREAFIARCKQIVTVTGYEI